MSSLTWHKKKWSNYKVPFTLSKIPNSSKNSFKTTTASFSTSLFPTKASTSRTIKLQRKNKQKKMSYNLLMIPKNSSSKILSRPKMTSSSNSHKRLLNWLMKAKSIAGQSPSKSNPSTSNFKNLNFKTLKSRRALQNEILLVSQTFFNYFLLMAEKI